MLSVCGYVKTVIVLICPNFISFVDLHLFVFSFFVFYMNFFEASTRNVHFVAIVAAPVDKSVMSSVSYFLKMMIFWQAGAFFLEISEGKTQHIFKSFFLQTAVCRIEVMKSCVYIYD